jgi:WD40 repeat protein
MRSARIRCMVAAVILLTCATASAQEAKKPRVDAVGDPLPAQALHRFGTSRFCTQTEVFSLVLSQDRKLLAAADRAGRVYLWDADTGKQRFVTAADAGKRVAISPDGQWLALGEDGPFEVRNLHKNEALRVPLGNTPRVFAFTPNSKAIAVTARDEADVVLYDIDSGKEARRFGGLTETVEFSTIAFSPDGKYLAVAGVPMVDMDKPIVRVVVWNARNGTKLKQIDQAGKQVRNLVFLSDNKTLVSQVGARLVAWDAATGDRVARIAHTVGSSFALDAKAKILATTDGPRGRRIRDRQGAARVRGAFARSASRHVRGW